MNKEQRKVRELGTAKDWAADLIGGLVLVLSFYAIFFVAGLLTNTPEHNQPTTTTTTTKGE